MRLRILSVIVLSLALPAAAHAQGAAVGAAGGAIVGGISDASRPRFHDYVVRQHITSFPYSGQIIVGTELPGTITYYDVPTEFGVKTYRYTVVNDTAVLVDPNTHRIVQIIG